jgi:hypothetical protein
MLDSPAIFQNSSLTQLAIRLRREIATAGRSHAVSLRSINAGKDRRGMPTTIKEFAGAAALAKTDEGDSARSLFRTIDTLRNCVNGWSTSGLSCESSGIPLNNGLSGKMWNAFRHTGKVY